MLGSASPLFGEVIHADNAEVLPMLEPKSVDVLLELGATEK